MRREDYIFTSSPEELLPPRAPPAGISCYLLDLTATLKLRFHPIHYGMAHGMAHEMAHGMAHGMAHVAHEGDALPKHTTELCWPGVDNRLEGGEEWVREISCHHTTHRVTHQRAESAIPHDTIAGTTPHH